MKKRNKVVQGVIPFVIVLAMILSMYLNISTYEKATMELSVSRGHLLIPKNSSDKVFLISGEFLFYPNNFLTGSGLSFNPNTFASKKDRQNKDKRNYAILTGSLKDTSIASNFGYGSYGLHIEGLNPSNVYSIRAPHAFSSCSIVIEGEEVASQGKIATCEQKEVPSIQSCEAVFRPDKNGRANIVFNLSNFTWRKGGFFSKIVLGEVNKANKMFRTDLIFNGIVFASILTVASFLFLLFFFYKQAGFLLWLSLAAITVAIRGMFFYPHLASQMFPDIPWQVSFVVRHLPLPTMLFSIAIKKALKLWYKIPYILLLSCACCYILSVFLLPAKTVDAIAFYYQIVIALFLVYNFAILLHALIKGREFAKWMFSAMSILIVVATYDLFIFAMHMPGLYFTPIGSLISIILIATMILKMYSTSIQKVDELRERSKKINNSLARFVPKGMMKLLNKKSIKDLEVGEYVEKRMPILSMDIRSFTKRSESMSPQSVFDFLNKYFATIVPIIREYNGIIPKYLGDGFFALFPDGVSSAVECALKMQKELKEKNIFRGSKTDVNIGIGIDLNDVLLGTVGNIERMDSIIISNAYKNTENMQDICKKYNSSIIVSSSVFSNLKPDIQLFARPVQLVKTKDRDTHLLYELYGNDEEDVRLLKTRSQVYLMDAFRAIAENNIKIAYKAFERSLSVFPRDPVATQYFALFKKK